MLIGIPIKYSFLFKNKGKMSNMYNKIEIGEQIKLLRKEKGWNQEELAERLSKKRQTISHWEDGRITFTMDTLIDICNLFECDIGYLLGYHLNKRHNTDDVSAATGLSKEAAEYLINGNRNCGDGEITIVSWFLNILLEDVGVNLLAHDVRSYYNSLKKSKFIEQNPDCEWFEYATVGEIRNLLSKPLMIPKLDVTDLTEEQRKQAKKEAAEYIANHNKKKREETFLKETQEKQAMYLWHIQQLFRDIIERGVNENDNEK